MKTFIKLDEDFGQDSKIRRLRRELGRIAVLDYIELLPIFRRYPNLDYQIPFSELDDIAIYDLYTTPDELKAMVTKAIEIGLYRSDKLTFWSDKRKNSLKEMNRISEQRKESGRKGGSARRKNSGKIEFQKKVGN